MSRRKIILFFIAGFIAIIAVIAARGALKAPPPKAAAVVEQPQVEILIAKKALPSGSFVQESDLEWKKWPAATPHEGLVTRDSGDADYNGAVVRSGLQPDEPVTVGRLLKTGDRGFLAAVLNSGMRAMTVKISPTSGVAGFIFPNDYVDVIMAQELDTGEGENGQKRRVSETVLENVRVLALDQKTSDQDKQAKVAELATLEVSPKQAEKLALVGQIGNLSLVLRSIAGPDADKPKEQQATNDNNGLDPKLVEAVKHALPASMPGTEKQGMTWDSDVSNALPAPPDLRNAYKVRIYRGSEASDMAFTKGE